MSNDLINCGLCRVQKLKRIQIKKIADEHRIKEGDFVEVFIKKVKK